MRLTNSTWTPWSPKKTTNICKMKRWPEQSPNWVIGKLTNFCEFDEFCEFEEFCEFNEFCEFDEFCEFHDFCEFHYFCELHEVCEFS